MTVRENTARYPQRKILPHDLPAWIEPGAVVFITICALTRGENQLCCDDRSHQLWDAIEFNRDRGLWWPHLVVLMPDHLHGLFSFATEPGMRKSIESWKHFVSRRLGIRWQRDFFDHRLRQDESVAEKASYIRMNPVRAGLVDAPDNWPYAWTSPGPIHT